MYNIPMARNEDEKFMAEALRLAGESVGAVEPNPPVGAMLVRDGVEIARGRHEHFGGPHAEINALAAAGGQSNGATMYVTLEPCCHHGKTPPCTEAIIRAGVSRVVVAMEDPDGHVRGRGVEILRKAGLEVDVGVCGEDARALLAPYIKLRTASRPWVICKWAQTADGLLALPAGRGRWISGEESRRRAHQLRSICDGVCVGIKTVLADNPLLNNRFGAGRHPARLVLDSNLRTAADCRLLRTADECPVIIVCLETAVEDNADKADELRQAGAEILPLPASEASPDLAALLDELGRRQWMRILVEGGAKVLENFIFSGLADELDVFVARRKVGDTQEKLPRFDVGEVENRLKIKPRSREKIGDDTLLRYVLNEAAG